MQDLKTSKLFRIICCLYNLLWFLCQFFHSMFDVSKTESFNVLSSDALENFLCLATWIYLWMYMNRFINNNSGHFNALEQEIYSLLFTDTYVLHLCDEYEGHLRNRYVSSLRLFPIWKPNEDDIISHKIDILEV